MALLVLFDIDGTLVDTDRAGRIALQQAFETLFGVTQFADKTRHVRFGGRTDPDIVEDLAIASGVAPETLRSHDAEFRLEYFRRLSVEMQRSNSRRRLYDGVLPLLERLQSEAVALGLVTGNFEQSARLKLTPFGINDYFPTGGFGSDDRQRARIAQISYERASRQHDTVFSPREVTVVGDTAMDVHCARENGFRAVAVRTGWAAAGEIDQAAADHVFDDLSDLPRALTALGVR